MNNQNEPGPNKEQGPIRLLRDYAMTYVELQFHRDESARSLSAAENSNTRLSEISTALVQANARPGLYHVNRLFLRVSETSVDVETCIETVSTLLSGDCATMNLAELIRRALFEIGHPAAPQEVAAIVHQSGYVPSGKYRDIGHLVGSYLSNMCKMIYKKHPNIVRRDGGLYELVGAAIASPDPANVFSREGDAGASAGVPNIIEDEILKGGDAVCS